MLCELSKCLLFIYYYVYGGHLARQRERGGGAFLEITSHKYGLPVGAAAGRWPPSSSGEGTTVIMPGVVAELFGTH